MKLKFAVTHTMRKGITPGAANGPGTPDSPASSRAAGRQLRSSVLLAIVAFCAIVVTTPARLVGQATEFGVLNGTVTDPGGRVIAKAHVKATDVQTGEVFSADATSSGQYRIFNLLPQQYTLTFTASGFKTVDVAPFKLDVGETLTQNAMLPVGPVSETVQVAASGELLETTTVGSITTFQEQTINDLPLNGRSYTSLIQYTPGADGTRINGQFSDGNRYVLDGSSNTTMLGASSAYVPNLDLIQEFSVDSHSSKAEEGGFLGATVTAATKSGTNRVRGDIFEFNRNNEFNASNPVNAKTVLPPFHQNQYGGVVGGPVYIPRIYNGHDKTFFFAGFQGLTLHQQSFSYSRVPTADELMGNFANSLFFIGSPNQVHLFDPATTTQNGNVTNRTAFAGDVIPAGRINSLVQGYLKYVLPAPNFTPNSFYPTSNRVDEYPNPTINRDYSLRVDHHISARDNVWVRYSQYSTTATSQDTAQIAQINRSPRKDIVADWVHSFNSKLFVESNYAYGFFPSTVDNTFPGGAVPSLTGLGFSAQQIATYGLPDFNGTGLSTPGLYGHYEQGQIAPFNLTESVSWNLGKHNLRSGVIVSRKDYTNTSVGHHYSFSGTQTEDPNSADPGSSNTGLGMASALLGLPSQVQLYYGNYAEAFTNWAVYAEDEWKILPHLTLDVGLRYDNFPTPNFTQGAINDWDAFTGIWYIGGGKLPPPCTTNPVAPCIPGTGNLADLPYGNMIQVAPRAGIRHPIHDNFGPRLGFAWNFDKNFVLRGGYSIYFDPESNTAQEDQNTFGLWPTSTNLNASYNLIGNPQTTINQIDGQVLSPTTTGVPWGTQSYFWDPAKKNPMSQQWNVDLQQQWSKSVVTTIAYIGSLQTRVDLTLDENAATTPGPGNYNASAVNARRPFPFYGTDTKFGTSLGRGNYNALQVKIEKRLSHDLQGLIAYTWSKSMDNGSSAWYSSDVQNAYNLAAAYGLSDIDRTHIVRMEATYQLPFGKGKEFLNHGPLAYIVGGWQVNALGQINSGRPIILSASNDPANIGNSQFTYARPDVIGSPYVSHRTRAAWFNTAAFAQPYLSYGNAPRNFLRNPPFQNMDASVFKNIPVREGIRMQLRLEAFNALNLITLGGVNGSFTNNSSFGKITGIGSTPRVLQIGGKLYF
jgi:hypothetical protein